MVDFIDIRKLSLEELNGVVSIYPWYGGARMLLCRKMAGLGSLSMAQCEDAALYVRDRSALAALMRSTADLSDAEAVRAAAAEKKEKGGLEGGKQNVFIVGGDYFSLEQYGSVRTDEDGEISKIASRAMEKEQFDNPVVPDADVMDFCTESLAQVYLEQGYKEEAKEIYSKLSLRYPEKSVYFASLIEKINKS